MRNLAILFVATTCFGACGNLTCDSEKKESINKLNAGVSYAKAKDYAAAEKELETATNLDPKNHHAWYTLGQVYADDAITKNDAAAKAEKWTKAADAFANAVKYEGKEAMYHYKLGQAFFEANKLDDARKELEKAVQINKRLFKAHWYLGKIADMQDRPHDAAVAFTEACHLNPGFGKSFVDLGILYVKWDDLQQAIDVLNAGATSARDPEDKTNIYYYLGLAYDGLQQWDKSIDAYTHAIDAAKAGNKENVEARLQLGMAYAAAGKKADAKKWLDEFLKMGGGQNAPNIQAANDKLAKLAMEN